MPTTTHTPGIVPPVRITPEWYVISLRPRGAHGAIRQAARRHGAGLIALSPWRLQALDDPSARAALARATSAPRVVFTSPAAVRAAAALRPLAASDPSQHWCAVGSGTAAALRRAGVSCVLSPARMDSEGLLGLPALQDIAGIDVGLVTAPGGRGALVPALRSRGAHVVRADIYRRVPVVPATRAVAALRALRAPMVLALSSGEALQRTLDVLPADALAALHRAAVVAASPRLAEMARSHGFDRVVVAAGPRPRDLVQAARRALAGRPSRSMAGPSSSDRRSCP